MSNNYPKNSLEEYLIKCIKQIEKISNNICYNDKSMKAMNSINTMYRYLKEVSNKFYNKETNSMNELYGNLLWVSINCKNRISDELYIIPTKDIYKFQKNFPYENNMNNFEETKILDYIIHETYDIYQRYRGFYPQNFETYDLTNSCYIISKIVQKLCNEHHIKCKTIKIDAGFSSKYQLFDGYGFHYFNIAELNSNQYIVDCTYKQFFLANENMIECLGIPFFTPPLAGCFMMMDEERCKVAKEILKSGYTLITPASLKHYLDGFTLSFRNGLYYEETINATYTTSYTYNQYLEFLYTDASLLDYENIELLGYQKRPLKNSKFIFKAK